MGTLREKFLTLLSCVAHPQYWLIRVGSAVSWDGAFEGRVSLFSCPGSFLLLLWPQKPFQAIPFPAQPAVGASGGSDLSASPRLHRGMFLVPIQALMGWRWQAVQRADGQRWPPQLRVPQPFLPAILALHSSSGSLVHLSPVLQFPGQKEPPGAAHLPCSRTRSLHLPTEAAGTVDTKGIATNGADF